MNSIDDLRRTLDTHAQSTDRRGIDPTSLHASIATAKRRRSATRAGAAVAAVAAVAAASLLPTWLDGDGRDLQPAAPVLLGVQAPQTKSALDLTYDYTASQSTATGREVTLELGPRPKDGPVPDQPLLTWTADDPAATVTVTLEGETDDEDRVIWSSTTNEFEDHVVVEGWAGERVTVAASTPGVAAAVYRVDPDAPIPGESDGDLVFRQSQSGRDLLGSAFGEPGATTLTATLPVRGDVVMIGTHCSGFGEDAAVDLLVDGEPYAGFGGCDDTGRVHAGGGVTYEVEAGVTEVDVELRVMESMESKKRLADRTDGVGKVAVSLRTDEPNALVGEHVVHRWVEQAGHLWERDELFASDADTDVTLPIGAGRSHLVQAVATTSPYVSDDEGRREAPSLTADGAEVRPTGSHQSPEAVATDVLYVAAGPTELSATASSTELFEQLALVTWVLAD